MTRVILIVHNIRSCHNVGSLLRTAEGLGVERVYLSGYTPYPEIKNDLRLPHIRHRATKQIEKTSLGAEKNVEWVFAEDLEMPIKDLRASGWTIAALEQAKNSLPITSYLVPKQIALVVGNEVDGLMTKDLELCDDILEIPMAGQKESFNVAVAAAIGLYHLKFLHHYLDK